MNITPLGWLGILVLFNSVIIGGTSQMDVIFGLATTKLITAIAVLANGFFGGLITMFSTQGAQVKNVLAMPGVEKINVNAQANSTLAAIAVDPNVNKIGPTPQAAQQVEAIAKGT